MCVTVSEKVQIDGVHVEQDAFLFWVESSVRAKPRYFQVNDQNITSLLAILWKYRRLVTRHIDLI